MKKLITLILIAGLGHYAWNDLGFSQRFNSSNFGSNAAIEAAFQSQQSNIQVSGIGTVQRILADDRQGSRHQRFILRLDSGQTLLVAHNIDLAPRIDSLRVGDSVEFNGEYEWNNKGGVLHWTHHDPQRRHAGGWLKHKGRTYQ